MKEFNSVKDKTIIYYDKISQGNKNLNIDVWPKTVLLIAMNSVLKSVAIVLQQA
jgi:hypothetical protein